MMRECNDSDCIYRSSIGYCDLKECVKYSIGFSDRTEVVHNQTPRICPHCGKIMWE